MATRARNQIFLGFHLSNQYYFSNTDLQKIMRIPSRFYTISTMTQINMHSEDIRTIIVTVRLCAYQGRGSPTSLPQSRTLSAVEAECLKTPDVVASVVMTICMGWD